MTRDWYIIQHQRIGERAMVDDIVDLGIQFFLLLLLTRGIKMNVYVRVVNLSSIFKYAGKGNARYWSRGACIAIYH